MKQTMMQAIDVCRSFANNGAQNHVLDMVNLDIYEQDFTVIMGSSGAGKSTLLYALSAMDSISSGKVLYKGKNISVMKEKELAKLRSQEFGFVFQQTHLISYLTLLENVVVSGFLDSTRTEKEIRLHGESLLEQMHVKDARHRLPSQVSGGEAQRSAIARAMINHPGIIFADEPTGALNKRSSEEVLDLLTTLNQQGQSIVMVTHDITAALRATRLLYLEDGKIMSEMNLAPYQESDAKSRETQINAWLSALKW